MESTIDVDESDRCYNVIVIAGDAAMQQEILVNVQALGYEVRVA